METLRSARSGVIGLAETFTTPFGARRLVYTDWTASSRAHQLVEDVIARDVLPLYGNTHDTHSICGRQSTCFREEARQIVAQATNAKVSTGDNEGGSSKDVVIFAGAGATGAANALVHILGVKERCAASASRAVVVLVGPFEHHSNILPWRESGAHVVRIAEDAEGRVDLAHLQRALAEANATSADATSAPLVIGAFCAASNVTGVLTDVDAVSALLHANGALAVWDYATAGPYLPIDMNPARGDGAYAKDAVFFSPHKFLGGVNSPGVLVVKKRLCRNVVPRQPGGGTVFFVTDNTHRFLSSRSDREEGGTPDIIGTVRAGLAMHLLRTVDPEGTAIRDEELALARSVHAQLSASAPNLVLLGPPTPRGDDVSVSGSGVERLPIFSFLIRVESSGSDGRAASAVATSAVGNVYLHHNFVTRILNDVFGIQARGGCACAGPYAQTLLGMTRLDPSASQGGGSGKRRYVEAFEDALLAKDEILRPGFTRLSLPWTLSPCEVRYVCSALELIAKDGWRLLPLYKFNHVSGEWFHRSTLNKFTERKWLSSAFASLRPATTTATAGVATAMPSTEKKEKEEQSSVLAAQLAEGARILSSAALQPHEVTSSISTAVEEAVMSEATRRLRWFMLPSEALALKQAQKQALKQKRPGAAAAAAARSEGGGSSVEERGSEDFASICPRRYASSIATSGSAVVAASTGSTLLSTDAEAAAAAEAETAAAAAAADSEIVSPTGGDAARSAPDVVVTPAADIAAATKSTESARAAPAVASVAGIEEKSSGAAAAAAPALVGEELLLSLRAKLKRPENGGKKKRALRQRLKRSIKRLELELGIAVIEPTKSLVSSGGGGSSGGSSTSSSSSSEDNRFVAAKRDVKMPARTGQESVSIRPSMSTRTTAGAPAASGMASGERLLDTAVSAASASSATVSASASSAATARSGARAARTPRPPKRLVLSASKAISEWRMIRHGDRVLVGLSGGKDSLTLLHILLELRRRAPIHFDIGAATVDPGVAAFDPRPLIPYVKSLGVPYFYETEEIFTWAAEKNPSSICSFCARMKRGRLYACARREGYNVLALGQHLDDIAESFIMGAFMNGELRAMKACYNAGAREAREADQANQGSGSSVTDRSVDHDDDIIFDPKGESESASPIRVIRPLIYTREAEMRAYAAKAGLPVITENCPACFEAPKERRRVKKMLAQQESLFPATFNHLRRALLPLMAADATRSLQAFAAQTRAQTVKWDWGEGGEEAKAQASEARALAKAAKEKEKGKAQAAAAAAL